MRFILSCFIFLLSSQGFAQSVLESKMDGSEQGKKITDFLKELQTKHSVKCFYIEEWFQNSSFEKSYQGATLSEALEDVLLGTEINFIWMNDYALVFVKDPSRAIQRKEIILSAIQAKKKVQKLTIGNPSGTSTKNSKAILRGKVLVGETKEPLIGASVLVVDVSAGSTTREDGSFELQVPVGSQIIRVGYVNYEESILDLDVLGDGELMDFTRVQHLR